MQSAGQKRKVKKRIAIVGIFPAFLCIFSSFLPQFTRLWPKPTKKVKFATNSPSEFCRHIISLHTITTIEGERSQYRKKTIASCLTHRRFSNLGQKEEEEDETARL